MSCWSIKTHQPLSLSGSLAFKEAESGIAEVEDAKKRLAGVKVSNFLSF